MYYYDILNMKNELTWTKEQNFFEFVSTQYMSQDSVIRFNYLH